MAKSKEDLNHLLNREPLILRQPKLTSGKSEYCLVKFWRNNWLWLESTKQVTGFTIFIFKHTGCPTTSDLNPVSLGIS